MFNPDLRNVLKNRTSRYSLVSAVAKRARDLSEQEDIRTSSAKPVSMAVKEIADGDIEVIQN
jgi:DNA-directed RNA polymerase omega subunit